MSENKGHLHLITESIREIIQIFGELGFSVAEGPEIEEEYYNFDALNVPKDHPARDMQDTFWIKGVGEKRLLPRTQTSAVQVRYMEKNKPPIRIIVPGKVFRNEATDRTHEAQFYQLEGLLVDENTHMGHLKGTLQYFFKEFFRKEVTIRMRASYFPFVEPGVEVDMSCFKCNGGGCTLCKHSGWIEIMGAGMVHPFVLKSAGIDHTKYQGFAFGGGIDRLLMLRHGIDDVRLFYNGDLRFVNQF